MDLELKNNITQKILIIGLKWEEPDYKFLNKEYSSGKKMININITKSLQLGLNIILN